jgi:hypothetical protein
MRAGDPVGVGRRYEPLWMGSSVWRACILDANAGPSALSSMMRTWDPGRVDAVCRPSARLPYTLSVDALAAWCCVCCVCCEKATTGGPQPRNARQPSPVRSRRLRGRRRLAHTGTLALQQAQSDGATQRRVACSSLADHTARPPLTVGISAVLGRRLPTDGKLARVLQCTRAASAQCCPASAAHDSTSPASTGPKELLCSPNYGAPAALDEQRRAASSTLAANRLA